MAAASALALLGYGCNTAPLLPVSGVPQYQEPLLIPVPVGSVNVAGGNLILSRTDLSIETRLGTWSVGATYNSTSGVWLWNFDLRYDGTTFVDESGYSHSLGALAAGAAVPGTMWVKVDADTLKTKGGLAYEFEGGRLAEVHWTSSNFPRIEMVTTNVAGLPRTTKIRQCFAAATCHLVYDLSYDATTAELVGIEDRTGRKADFDWNASGQLIQARDGLDVAKSWTGHRYDYVGGRLAVVRTSEQERVEIDYDAAGRVTHVRPIGEENPIFQFQYYGSSANIYETRFTNPVNVVTAYRYDALRRVVNVQNLTTSEQAFYEWTGLRPTRMQDPAGLETSWTYTGDDVATRTDPSGNVVTLTYQTNGVDRENPDLRPILQITDSVGLVQRRGYDANGRLIWVENGEGEAYTFEYAGNEMLDKVIRPDGTSVKQAVFGQIGLPEEVTVAGDTTQYRYDGVGNLTNGLEFSDETSTGRGGVWKRVFDEDRNLVAVKLANQTFTGGGVTNTVTIHYRSDGRWAKIDRTPSGNSEFVYDALGRMVERKDFAQGTGHADWQSHHLEYDAMGRQTAFERPNGMREEWTFDPASRVKTKTVKQDNVIEATATYTYGDGRLLSMLESVRGAPETYTYDSAGRVASVTYPNGEINEFTYDLRSRTEAEWYRRSNGTLLRLLAFGYDLADREVDFNDFLLQLVHRTYVNGRVEKVRYGNGLERTFRYHATRGTLTGSETKLGTTVVEDTSIDSQGSFAAMPFNVDAVTETFGALPVRTREQYALLAWSPTGANVDSTGPRITFYAPDNNPDHYQGFEFDWLNNFLGTGATDAIYNAQKNRILRIENAGGQTIHSYAYDEAGFTTTRDGVALGWTGTGRIRTIGPTASFVWDTRDELVSFTVGGTTRRTRFGGGVTADAAGNPTHLDRMEVRIDLNSGAHLYRHFDLRGNVKFTTDDDGDVVAHYHYDPFGVRATHGAPGGFEQDRSFAEGPRVGGLYMLGARLYDAAAARFLTPDPKFQVINQYAYASGNPLWFSDPTGNDAFTTGLRGIAAWHADQAARINYISTQLSIITAETAAIVNLMPGKIGTGLAAGVVAPMAPEIIRINKIAREHQETADFLNQMADILDGVPPEENLADPQSGASSARSSSARSQESGREKGCVGTCIGPARWHRSKNDKGGKPSSGGGGGPGGPGGGGGPPPPPIPGCFSPVELVQLPQLGWLLAVLLPAQAWLALLVVRRRAQARAEDEEADGER